MTFALVAFLMIGCEIHAFHIDARLSYDDCMSAVSQGVDAIDIAPGLTVDATGAALVCEIEA